jgi:alkylation response protein AidB-like acyl-CoA dehydrogenase
MEWTMTGARLEAVVTTAAEEDLRREVREFVREECQRPDVRIGLGMAAGHDPDFSRRLAARGWVGMGLPARYGGREYSAVQRFIVSEELLAAGLPLTAHWIADRQTAPSILRYGTDEQRERFLPAIARGECYFSIGMSEPEAGSDLASVRTVASRTDGGWVLNGAKTWTSLAHLNHYVLLLARVEGTTRDERQLIQLIVDTSSPGVQLRPIPLLTGEHHFNSLFLDNVAVPAEMVLGEPGQGWEQVTNELVMERCGPDRFLSAFPLMRLFVAQLGRERDGQLAGAVGRLLANFWSIRQMSLAVARLMDGSGPASLYAAMAKDLGTVLEQDMVELIRRFSDVESDAGSDSDFGRLLEEAILMAASFTIRGGTTEILRSIISRGLDNL